jgi:hypothetical protein
MVDLGNGSHTRPGNTEKVTYDLSSKEMVDLGNDLPKTKCYSSRTVYALTQSIGSVGAVMRPSNPYQVFRDLSIDDDVKSFTYSFSECTC